MGHSSKPKALRGQILCPLIPLRLGTPTAGLCQRCGRTLTVVGSFQIDPPEALGAREGQPQARPARVYGHVPHDRARRRDLYRLRTLRGRVERHDLVGARLVVPNAPVGADGDAVRLAAVATRAGEVAHLSSGGIEPAQLAAGVVRVPHDPVTVHDPAAGPTRGSRERESAQGAVRGSDATEPL